MIAKAIILAAIITGIAAQSWYNPRLQPANCFFGQRQNPFNSYNPQGNYIPYQNGNEPYYNTRGNYIGPQNGHQPYYIDAQGNSICIQKQSGQYYNDASMQRQFIGDQEHPGYSWWNRAAAQRGNTFGLQQPLCYYCNGVLQQSLMPGRRQAPWYSYPGAYESPMQRPAYMRRMGDPCWNYFNNYQPAAEPSQYW
ncbi:uncharacterized protein LOC107040816 [Diachasma alloeum]|uniref:uncharacterized protein LOC107040816 n=1 Tax=Diachasma alloeum TaxID=454923 RepID=UPI00073814D0|nr:uncharacterized protein LOC107040816 [Diachasma alloeum]